MLSFCKATEQAVPVRWVWCPSQACAGSAGKLGNSLCCNFSPAGLADGSTFKVDVSVEFLCPNSAFWLGSWYSLNAGQNVNPHICILRFVNWGTVKCCRWLLLQDFACVLKNFSEI